METPTESIDKIQLENGTYLGYWMFDQVTIPFVGYEIKFDVFDYSVYAFLKKHHLLTEEEVEDQDALARQLAHEEHARQEYETYLRLKEKFDTQEQNA